MTRALSSAFHKRGRVREERKGVQCGRHVRTRPLRPRLPLRASEEEVVERLVSVGEAFFDRSPTADPNPCALLCAAELLSAITRGSRIEKRNETQTRALPSGCSLKRAGALLEKWSASEDEF